MKKEKKFCGHCGFVRKHHPKCTRPIKKPRPPKPQCIWVAHGRQCPFRSLIRGLCQFHYNKMYLAILSGAVNEEEAIAKGRILRSRYGTQGLLHHRDHHGHGSQSDPPIRPIQHPSGNVAGDSPGCVADVPSEDSP